MKLPICILLAGAAVSFACARARGEVTIILNGVEDTGGVLLVYLQGEREFLEPGAGLAQRIEATAGSVTLKYMDVPAGDYAVTVVHDANGNGKMDIGDDGIPTEGWGTLYPDRVSGRPAFQTQNAAVPAAGATLAAGMIYFAARPVTTPPEG